MGIKINKNIKGLEKFLFLIIIIILLNLNIVLATPNSLNIQGKLTNPSGNLLTGTYNFSFRIYDSFTSGTILYEAKNMTLTTDSRGVYDAILRNINLPFYKQYYLAVKVSDDSEMEPRVNLTSVPYAFTSNQSKALNTTRDVFINDNINLTSTGNIDLNGTLNANNLKAATQLDVGGGFSNGGLTVQQDGDIVTQGDV